MIKIKQAGYVYLVKYNDEIFGAFPTQEQAEKVAESIINDCKAEATEFGTIIHEWATPLQYGFLYRKNHGEARVCVTAGIERVNLGVVIG